MAHLPTAYVDKLSSRAPSRARDGMSAATLAKLVDRLADADVYAPSVTSLMRGKLGLDHTPAALFVLADCRLQALADWADSLSAATYASILGCSVNQLDAPGCPGATDMPLLTGHGIVLASRGVSGKALVGMPLEELRGELEESRRKLSKIAGYQVRILMPTTSMLGGAVDGLVLEEAQRAGYKLVLGPGRSVTELDKPRTNGAASIQTLHYRTVRTDDSASHLHDWILGKGLSRQVAQVRDLVNRPRRILSRFGIE